MQQMIRGYVPLVELTRGKIVECIHFGAFTIVDSSGKLLASAGDPDLVTFPRSAMKPIQVLPFIEHEGFKQFNFTDEEVAIMCASHSGSDAHVSVLREIHKKAGLQESDLQCGVHWPFDKSTSDSLLLKGEKPTPYRHNCAGKHSGMLAFAKTMNRNLDGYLEPGHTVQVKIRETLAQMCQVEKSSLVSGIDGCSAPVYAMPLYNFSLAVASLCDPSRLSLTRQSACKKITNAMMAYPEMVSGSGRLDTVLMETLKNNVISKGGAEGFQMLGIMPGVLRDGSPGIGISIKFSDGDPSRRATHIVVDTILNALGFQQKLNTEDYKKLSSSTLRNWRGLLVGEIKPIFEMPLGL